MFKCFIIDGFCIEKELQRIADDSRLMEPSFLRRGLYLEQLQRFHRALGNDRVLVMDFGKVIQRGDPEEIYFDPSNEFVADFIGKINLKSQRNRTTRAKKSLTKKLSLITYQYRQQI